MIGREDILNFIRLVKSKLQTDIAITGSWYKAGFVDKKELDRVREAKTESILILDDLILMVDRNDHAPTN